MAEALTGQGIEYPLHLHASPSSVLSRTEAPQAARLCEVVKQHLWAAAKRFVEQSSAGAVLYSYGSDGTPLLTMETHGLHPGMGSVLYRRAKESGEYLIERAFPMRVESSADNNVEYKKALLARDPRPLTGGKTALHLFRACTEIFPALKGPSFRHPGIAISHYSFEGLCSQPSAAS